GVALGVNAIEVPRPARRVMVEAKQSLVSECGEKLDREERIASRPLPYESRERCGVLRVATQGIGNQLAEMRAAERSKLDLAHRCAGISDGLELPCQRMRRIDLVVPIGTDQDEVLQIRPGQQILNEVERGGVEPLQIVEEQRKRMLRTGEYAD